MPRKCERDISTDFAVASKWRPRRRAVSDSMPTRTASEPPLRHRRATEQARTEPARAVQHSIGKSDQGVEQIVGSVDESREAHLKRCQQPGCPRCRWYQIGHRWQATYGSLEVEAGPRGKIIWLSERPAKWKGAWALGCNLCAEALARRQVLGDTAGTHKSKGIGERRTGRTNCTWARYEVRPSYLQAEHVKQHACSDCHKFAVQAFLRPDAPVRLTLQRDHTDDQLLHGAVPQLQDWVRVWRWAREGDSWASAERHSHTENWIDQLRFQYVVRSRAIRNMAIVMREIVRAKKREQVMASTCISLSFDDRKAYKLVKFNCDVPVCHHRAPLQAVPLCHHGAPSRAPWVSGVIGCLDTLHGDSMESLDEDYAEQTCAKIMDMIGKFATPLGLEGRYDAIYNKFRTATRSIIVDGALLKSARVLRQKFLTGVILIGRDPAHMVRTSVSEPWIRTGRFEEQHRMLFSDKRALIKNVQHSDLFQARLQACQRDILAEHGSQGGGVVNVLRHFSFAPHRWESFAAPRRQYCCMLQAIFKCLGVIAGDWRVDKAKRVHAEKCMDDMSGAHAVEVGIAGDYSEACMRFIRLWDQPDKDPATSAKDIAEFRHLIDVLFVKGYILCDPGDADGESPLERLGGTAGHCGRTITQIAFEQLMQAEHSHVTVMGRQKRMWWRGNKEAVLDMMKEVKCAVQGAFERMDADFSPNSLYLCFEVFDLAAWQTILKADDVSESQRLLRKGRLIFEALSLEWNEPSFVTAVEAALACSAHVAPTTPKYVRNRAIWAVALASSQGPDPMHGASDLLWAEPALRFYWSYKDGTGDVERLLGNHTRFQGSHPDSDQVDDSTEICLELKAEGPQHEGDIAAQGFGGMLLMTEFSRDCARLWRAHFGTRFACQSRRKDVGRHFPEKLIGSLKHVRVQHNIAVGRLLEAAVGDEADRVAQSRRRTIFGFRRRAIDRIDAPPEPGKSMGNFIRRTKAIKEEKAQHRVWTGCEGVPRLRPKEKAKTQLDIIRSVAVPLRARQASASSRGIGAKRRALSSSRITPFAKRKVSSQSSAPFSASASSQSGRLPAANAASSRRMTTQLAASPAATVGTASVPPRGRRVSSIALVPDIVKEYTQRMRARSKQQRKAAKSATLADKAGGRSRKSMQTRPTIA